MLSSFALGVLLSGGSVIDLDASIFIQMGIFFVAFFILKALVFNPTMQLFDAREQAIDGAKAEAKRMQDEAVAKREHFEGELRRVSSAANEERETARLEAQKLARQLTEQARSQALSTQKAAKDRLDVQAAEVRKNALAQVPIIARELTSKLLGRSVQ
ncbi:MAG TPA: ATP synthase F0 subunit B [Polyangiales bacterium]|jgi:F-type H+-transporting ATPase subunit b|nr:ATP synthase F0 subunit B [Polyangiales bacterium]